MTDTFPAFARLSIPNSDSPQDPVGGSYLRLGRYLDSAEASYLPSNLDVADPDAQSCSGLFLKTNGVAFVRIDGDAYEEYRKNLKTAVDGEFETVVSGNARIEASGILLTTRSDGAVVDDDITMTAETGSIILDARSGNLSATASGSMEFTANDGDFEIKADGNLVKSVTESVSWTTSGNTLKQQIGAFNFGFTMSRSLAFALGIQLYTSCVDIAVELVWIGVYRRAIFLAVAEIAATKATIEDKKVEAGSTVANIESTEASVSSTTVTARRRAISVQSQQVKAETARWRATI